MSASQWAVQNLLSSVVQVVKLPLNPECLLWQILGILWASDVKDIFLSLFWPVIAFPALFVVTLLFLFLCPFSCPFILLFLSIHFLSTILFLRLLGSTSGRFSRFHARWVQVSKQIIASRQVLFSDDHKFIGSFPAAETWDHCCRCWRQTRWARAWCQMIWLLVLWWWWWQPRTYCFLAALNHFWGLLPS